MAEAPIEVVPYDPRWPAAFERERALLEATLALWLVGPPEHIGSTAVPGLAAKPVIDIMAPVTSIAASYPAIDAARALGYQYFPYKSEVMHWFCKPSPEHRTHHLHLVPMGSSLWRERLAFRDALRANAGVRDAYATLKRTLAARHCLDREAYTDAKTPFIERVLQSALLCKGPN